MKKGRTEHIEITTQSKKRQKVAKPKTKKRREKKGVGFL
jgi:hypothetical protein